MDNPVHKKRRWRDPKLMPFECPCGSREFIPTVVGMFTKGGKTQCGTKMWRCYGCKAIYPR